MGEQQKQISKLAGTLTEHQDYFGVMSIADRQWVIQNAKEAIGLFADAVKNRAVKVAKKLLQFLYGFTTTFIDKFDSTEKFREGETIDGVSIAWLGDNLKKHVLGKTETNVPAVDLKVHKLLEVARDLPKNNEPGIISALNGKHEIALAHFHQLLAYKQQKDDYSWTVAYIIGNDGVTLWAVYAGWNSGFRGWNVEASSVEDPYGWVAGRRVASC